MNIAYRPMASLRVLLACLALAPLGFSIARAEALAANDSRINVNYRDLVDESVYGHSGRPAEGVLDTLQVLALVKTSKDLARQAVAIELRVRATELEAQVGDEPLADGEAAEKRKQLAELEELLNDEEALERRAADYAAANKEDLDARVRDRATRLKMMLADVEPVCEPAAMVLNDALSQKDPATLNSRLVELVSFYPGGVPEPAWADLVRSRRLVVYTDGDAYCRLFLPGKDAAAAWQASYGVVRHVLRSLLKPDQPNAALMVDVYAYENDIATTTFTLHLEKLTKRLAAKDLGAAPGLRAVNLDRLAAFFDEGLILEGCGVNAVGNLVLIGRDDAVRPTLDGEPIGLSDLAVAYRAAAYAGHGESYMSLDPAPDPSRVNVNFGGRLYDTRLGWVAYRCDLRFKTLSSGLDPVSFVDQKGRIQVALPDFVGRLDRFFSDAGASAVSSESTRFWFYPDDFGVVTSADLMSCLVKRPRFTAAAERQAASDAEGNALKDETPPWTAKTLEHFNANYDKFGRLFPEVTELDHAARLLAVGEWLYQGRMAGRIALDLDELLAVELPAVPTPRSREQLEIMYARKVGGAPGEYKTYCLSTPAGREACERDSKAIYGKDLKTWRMSLVTGGGLDLSARKTLEKAAIVEGADADAIRKAMTATENATVDMGDGRKLKARAAGGSGGGTPPGKPVTVAAGGDLPDGDAFKATGGTYNMLGGGQAKVLSVREGKGYRHQRFNAKDYDKDGILHSVWVDEHGTPQRFSTRTSEGQVTFMLETEGNAMRVARQIDAREPNEHEVQLLTDILGRKGVSSAEVWNTVPADAAVRALDVGPKGDVLVLFEEEGTLALRATPKGGAPELLRGDAAMQRMHRVSAEKVRAFSEPGKVELLHVRLEGEKIILTVGRRDPVEIDVAEWGKWLSSDGDAGPSEPVARVFKDLADANGGSGAELVVMRDALQSRPQRSRSDVGLEGIDRPAAEIQAEVKTLSLGDAELAVLAKELEAYKSRSFAEVLEVQLRLEEVNGVRKMTPQERAAAIAELEVEQSMAASLRTANDVVELTAALKSKLPRLRVSLDDPSPALAGRVQSEGRVTRASDVGLAVPPHRAGVDDRGMLPDIVKAFSESNLTMIKKPADLAKVGNVILVAAHNDRALFDYIQSLGEHRINGKSALDGKFLMLETCFEPGNPNLVSELLRRYNCTGVHVQSVPVHKDAVKQVLVEMATELKKLDGTQPPQRLRDVYEATVQKLMASDDPELQGLRGEFQKLLKASVQWCGATEGLPRNGTSAVG